MLNLSPPDYQFCPFCGTSLLEKSDGEQMRKYCPKDNWIYYPRVATSASAVILKDNKIILVQRNREPFKGKWMLPSGFVDYGELPEETIRREVKEETGLEVLSMEFRTVVQSIDDIREPGHFLFVYNVTVRDGQLKTDEAENQAIGWFDLKDVPDLAFITHREIVKNLK